MTSEDRVYERAAQDALADRPVTLQLDSLGATLVGEFAQAKMDRKSTEERWLKDLRQYRGVYDPEEEALMGPNRSRAYMRKTRVKVKTVDSRVADLLFPAGREKNWTIEPTPKPTIDPAMLEQIKQTLAIQAQAAGQELPPDAIEEAVKAVATEASKGMSSTIEDQLTETRYKQASIAAIHSGHLFGIGIIKGPLVERKIRQRYAPGKGGRWVSKSETYVVPFVESVPIWRWYPDMQATVLDDCRYVYEDHKLSKFRMVELSKRRSFRKDLIVAHLLAHPEGCSTDEYFEGELKTLGDRDARVGDGKGFYQVLERWGWLDGAQLKQAGVNVPEDRMHETFFSNVWMLPDGNIIRAVLQPLNGQTWPYHLYYFDKDETSLFGEGLATVMREDQKMLNAAIRMILDNAAISAGPQLEIAIGLLASIERVDEIVPWKVWQRNSQQPGQPAIRVIDTPNNLAALTAIKEMFETSADEVTAIPRYMSGENVSQGAAGTASGMSMLMAAANIVIKDLITSWDEGVTRNFLQALYQWNMQFNADPKIKGDFDVKARGTASLVAKEVRARALAEMAAATNNPTDIPLIKRAKLLREMAEANEMGDIVKSDDELKQEQESDLFKKNQQLQMELAEAQVREIQGRAAKLMADAEVAKKKVDEMMANIELTIAKAVESRVNAVYASIQAGGTVITAPQIAPAADEILRSSNWKDYTPSPEISQLNTTPVQAEDGEFTRLNKGQSFVVAPRTNEPQSADPQYIDIGGQAPQPGGVPAQTGEAGKHAGIETQRIE